MKIKKDKLNAALLGVALIEILALMGMKPTSAASYRQNTYNPYSQDLIGEFAATQMPFSFVEDNAQLPLIVTKEEYKEVKINPTPSPRTKPRVASAFYIKPNAEIVKPAVAAPAEIDSIIDRYSQEYGVDKGLLVKIAKCESGFNSNAVNGPYAGMYQFIEGTWVSNRRAMELDANPSLRYNAEESIRTAAFKIARDGGGAWPVCSQV